MASLVAAAMSTLALCGAVAIANADGPDKPADLLAFAGADAWRYAGFLYGGALWSPAGLDASGFAVKLLFDGGVYTYPSGALGSNVTGTLTSAAALPGWRFTSNGLIVTLFAGPIVQDYRLSPFDPGSRLHGLYVGGQFAGEAWYQPNPVTMAAVNGDIASIGPTGSLRAAVGVRLFDRAFVGPEVREIWCAGQGDGYFETQIGLHVTALRVGALEWSAAGGFAFDSDRREGPYLRLGVNTRF